jgi:hypothetical protein
MMKQYTRKDLREALEVRGYSERTIEIYTYHMVQLAAYFNRPPHTLGPEHIHQYQVHLVKEKKVSWTLFNQSVCAMRFFLPMWCTMTGQ